MTDEPRTTEPYEIAMFPLGSVLFTSMVMPLHLFEPRYLALADDVLAGDREFGVVLIERGHEVGGGEQRSMVGTVARVVEEHRFDDGRWALGSVGTRRIRVVEWLEDDPYPRAMVVDLPDELGDEPPHLRRDRQAECSSLLDRVLERKVRLGEAPAAGQFTPHEDPSLASFQISTIAGFGPADGQELLEAESVDERFELLETLLDDMIAVLDFRLS